MRRGHEDGRGHAIDGSRSRAWPTARCLGRLSTTTALLTAVVRPRRRRSCLTTIDPPQRPAPCDRWSARLCSRQHPGLAQAREAEVGADLVGGDDLAAEDRGKPCRNPATPDGSSSLARTIAQPEITRYREDEQAGQRRGRVSHVWVAHLLAAFSRRSSGRDLFAALMESIVKAKRRRPCLRGYCLPAETMTAADGRTGYRGPLPATSTPE